jgi:CBS domain-containing protein
MPAPLSARELMSTDVETVGPAATVRAVAEHFAGAAVGSVVVTDEAGFPLGIVTGTDLSRVLAEGGDPDAAAAGEVMTARLVTVDPDTTATQAAATMRDHGVRHLVVVDSTGSAAAADAASPVDGSPLGLLSATDLAYALPDVRARERDTDGPSVEREATYDPSDWSFEGGAAPPLAVGDEFRFTKTLTDADVEAFAEATGDTNRLHLDDGYARETRFGGRIVHGVLTAGVVSAAVARLPGMPIYLAQDCEFTAPVRPGERVTAELAVVEALDDARYRLTTVVRDESAEIVLEGEARVLVDEAPD